MINRSCAEVIVCFNTRVYNKAPLNVFFSLTRVLSIAFQADVKMIFR